MFLTADATNLDVTDRQSAGLIRKWLDAVGLTPEAFPVDTDDAATILREGAEYDIGADGLRDLAARGQVPKIESWDARDVLAAACCLEGRRAWRPTPSVHDAKKSQTKLALENCIAAGAEGLAELREHFANFDLQFALILLCEAPNRELREKMLSTVEALLILRDAERE